MGTYGYIWVHMGTFSATIHNPTTLFPDLCLNDLVTRRYVVRPARKIGDR